MQILTDLPCGTLFVPRTNDFFPHQTGASSTTRAKFSKMTRTAGSRMNTGLL